MRKLLIFLSICTAAAGIAFGQATQQAATQAAPPLPTEFDAATIKPWAPPSVGENARIFSGTQVDPGRLTATAVSLKQLIETAYGLKPYQVVGPDWMDSERFDVSAETSTAVPRDKMAALLQPFLEQQFKLKTHRDSKVMDTYTLIVTDKSKLKLASSAGVKPDMPEPPPDGRDGAERRTMMMRGPLPPGAFQINMSPQGMMLNANASMQTLVNMLARQLDKPVVDGTELEGNYEIHLTYAPPPGFMGGPKGGFQMPDNAKMKDNGSSPDDTSASAPAPSLFTALQQQMGLKLNPQKAPVELLVVDHAEKTPVGN